MLITEFFDPNNLDHLKAFNHLSVSGLWPENFLPDDIEFTPVWRLILLTKMAECWLNSQLPSTKKVQTIAVTGIDNRAQRSINN